eukprot:gene17440-biopygen18884
MRVMCSVSCSGTVGIPRNLLTDELNYSTLPTLTSTNMASSMAWYSHVVPCNASGCSFPRTRTFGRTSCVSAPAAPHSWA